MPGTGERKQRSGLQDRVMERPEISKPYTNEDGERWTGMGLKCFFLSILLVALACFPSWVPLTLAAIFAVTGLVLIAGAFFIAYRLRTQPE